VDNFLKTSRLAPYWRAQGIEPFTRPRKGKPLPTHDFLQELSQYHPSAALAGSLLMLLLPCLGGFKPSRLSAAWYVSSSPGQCLWHGDAYKKERGNR
jgi:hypothetical protein